jgi:CHASE1-domain containing sensor protein
VAHTFSKCQLRHHQSSSIWLSLAVVAVAVVVLESLAVAAVVQVATVHQCKAKQQAAAE